MFKTRGTALPMIAGEIPLADGARLYFSMTVYRLRSMCHPIRIERKGSKRVAKWSITPFTPGMFCCGLKRRSGFELDLMTEPDVCRG